jgi:hypothetical protein
METESTSSHRCTRHGSANRCTSHRPSLHKSEHLRRAIGPAHRKHIILEAGIPHVPVRLEDAERK